MGGLFFRKSCKDRATPRGLDRSPAGHKLLSRRTAEGETAARCPGAHPSGRSSRGQQHRELCWPRQRSPPPPPQPQKADRHCLWGCPEWERREINAPLPAPDMCPGLCLHCVLYSPQRHLRVRPFSPFYRLESPNPRAASSLYLPNVLP